MLRRVTVENGVLEGIPAADPRAGRADLRSGKPANESKKQ